MQIYFSIVMFLIGSCFGSFFNVVGSRLPRNQSIITPSSHCESCHHKLKGLDLIPIFSFFFLKGKCRYCHQKLGIFYPFFEAVTGILFMVCYLLYGFSFPLLIALTFVSLLLIVIISDYQTMIIPDSVLIVFAVLLLVEIFISTGISECLKHVFYGIISSGIMLCIKLFGDFLFKKESMGGGDIKLMFLIGLMLGWPSAILSVLFASFIALPPALILYREKENHEIPFGPFLSIAAIILLLSGIDMNFIIDLLTI